MTGSGGGSSRQGEECQHHQDQKEFNNSNKRRSALYKRALIVIFFCGFLLIAYDSKFESKNYGGMHSTTLSSYYSEISTTMHHTDTLDSSIDNRDSEESDDGDVTTDNGDQNDDDDVPTSIDTVSTTTQIMLNKKTRNKKTRNKKTYLKHFYHDLWNFKTNSITIPDKKPNDPITSLEILEDILKQDDITKYMSSPSHSSEKDLPSCFIPNINKTQELGAKVEAGNVTLGLPVLNAGFPKCGSSTLHEFFTCAGYKSDHSEPGGCIAHALQIGQPPIAGCKTTRNYETFLQLDIQHSIKKSIKRGCWYPQISFLDEFHHEHPNATFIIVFRPVDDWIRSITSWGTMYRRMTLCKENIPGLMQNPYSAAKRKKKGKKELNTLSRSDMRHWWCNHVKHIREFVKQYPSHNLVEIDLYNGEQSSQIMSKLFTRRKHHNDNDDNNDDDEDNKPGNNEICWGHANTNIGLKKRLKRQERNRKNSTIIHDVAE